MKSRFTILSVLLLFRLWLAAQQPYLPEEDVENDDRLEDISEAEDMEPEDDYDLQQLATFRRHPVNLNDAALLTEFPLLSPLQATNLVKYRGLLGNLISIYELQAVPGFTAEDIRRIMPYVTVSSEEDFATLKKRFADGRSRLLLRYAFIPEKASGFEQTGSPSQQFTGSRPRLFFRYLYSYGKFLQYGVTGDKDAGERFLVNGRQWGFDFVSLHLFIRRMGIVHALALGDYTVNLGQGLIQWQSQAYKKSSAVIDIKRNAETLRPYSSAGEYNFSRGCAVTLEKAGWQATLFTSLRKLSANTDTDSAGTRVITSFQNRGLHRTTSEVEDRNIAGVAAIGGSLKYSRGLSHIAVNAIRLLYSLPLLKRDEPYNLFAMKGDSWMNVSVDYAHTIHNVHLFGEFAVDKNGRTAAVNGMMVSLHEKADLAILHRDINAGFQSFAGNAFTENSAPSNEHGVYAGLSLKPDHRWRIDLYADFFSFPWLKYRVDAPATGSQYLVQLTWLPAKGTELYSRLRTRNRPLNTPDLGGTVRYPFNCHFINWRTHLNIQAGKSIIWRSRVELCWFDPPERAKPEIGCLFYADVAYKPFGKWYTGSVRFQVFETDTRIYAYENDVLFSSSTPAFYDAGTRYYLNIKARLRTRFLKNAAIDLGLKVSGTVYNHKTSVGSGPDEIAGNRKSELKLQILLSPGS